MEFNEDSFKKALKDINIIRWENHFKKVIISYLKHETKALNIAVVTQQRELFDAVLDFSEELPMCTEDYHRSELWKKYKALNCG